jgi:two-component system CheB/CheR fusion protein
LQRALHDTERQRRRAEEANAAKSQFLAAASHDLRQPLQAISLFVDLLAGSLTGKNQEVAQKAKEAVIAGRSLLDSLLDLSLLDAGTQKVQICTFSLNEPLQGLHAEFATQFAAHGLKLRLVPCSAMVTTDPVLLSRIIRNLLVNALRYTSSGRVLMGCRRIGGRVRVEVWDTGPGIPADKLGAIFREYYQLDQPQATAVKGLGLGLSIVAKTAELLRLRVGVRSRPGKGSVFFVDVRTAEAVSRDGVPESGQRRLAV